ncbi:hypothetical protein EC973_006933, partial [Apophysomyces ossiformis]
SPFCRNVLGPALKEAFGCYGRVLNVQLCTDDFGLLTLKEYVLLDTSSDKNSVEFQKLKHEVHFEVAGRKRIILARWCRMTVHYNYCKKEGHKVATCPTLRARKDQTSCKICYNCDSADHLITACPKIMSTHVGEK